MTNKESTEVLLSVIKAIDNENNHTIIEKSRRTSKEEIMANIGAILTLGGYNNLVDKQESSVITFKNGSSVTVINAQPKRAKEKFIDPGFLDE